MKRQAAFFIFMLLTLGMVTLLLSKNQESYKHRTSFVAKLMKTRLGFHFWLYGSKLKHGTSFSFNRMASDQIQRNLITNSNHEICVQYDASGNICTIHDGKTTPLFLGSIPTKQSHLNRLRTYVLPDYKSNQTIGIFSLNEYWECKTSGLFELIKHNPDIDHHFYPTPDYQAPSFVDILRAVNDLENRDNLGHQICLVHCKAGRGRSATILGAYVMHILHKAQLNTTTTEVERYLRTHRPQVHLEEVQKNALDHFYRELQNADTFEKLYEKYLPEIEARIGIRTKTQQPR